MKFPILLFWFFFYSPLLLADAKFYKCTVDGVATFQSQPCQELLNGKQETENAKSLQIDTSQNSISKPEHVTSDVIDRAKKSGYYYDNNQYKYFPNRTSTDYSNDYYDSAQARKKSEDANNKSMCESYRSREKQLHKTMKQGYSHSRSESLHRQRREIEENISKYCY